MTDVQESTGKPAAKRVRSGRASQKAPAAPAVPQGYVAMHEINAAMCLAGGILAPRFEESAARDHHVVAGEIQVDPMPPSAQSLAAAQGDLSYGNVVVFEVPLPAACSAPLPSLPLWRASRLIFESSDTRDLFRARMSGYGDVPHDVLPMEVSAEAFSARGAPAQTSLLEPADATEEDTDAAASRTSRDVIVAKAFRAIDRCAGSLLAATSTLHGSPGGTRLVEALGGLAPGKPSEAPVEQFASTVASLADSSPDAATFAPMFAAVASILSSGAMDDGYSAKALLREAEPMSIRGLQEGSPQQLAIQKFWAFTKDVLELRREVPEGAWSDEGGSAIARGTLLFMLNPEPEQLRAVRERTLNVGSAVHFIAGLLVGIRSGVTRLGSEVKAAREPFLAGAAFAHDWMRGQDALLALKCTWEAEDGSRSFALAYDGVGIANAKAPADPARLALAHALRSTGVEARFALETGALFARLVPSGLGATFGAVDATVPAFPRQPALEVWTLVGQAKLARRAVEAIAAEVGAGTREHFISAKVVEEPAGRAAVRLSALALKGAAGEALKEAAAALVAKASEVARHIADKSPRGVVGGKQALRANAEPELGPPD